MGDYGCLTCFGALNFLLSLNSPAFLLILKSPTKPWRFPSQSQIILAIAISFSSLRLSVLKVCVIFLRVWKKKNQSREKALSMQIEERANWLNRASSRHTHIIFSLSQTPPPPWLLISLQCCGGEFVLGEAQWFGGCRRREGDMEVRIFPDSQ